MGEENENNQNAEDTIVLTAEDMNQILDKTSEAEKSEEDEDASN